jgi:site-specific recombinase XerD
MVQASIMEGPHRVPKGLRHGYAINALNKGVQLNLVSKWLGHSAMETTAIYANAVGAEQRAVAARMWS